MGFNKITLLKDCLVCAGIFGIGYCVGSLVEMKHWKKEFDETFTNLIIDSSNKKLKREYVVFDNFETASNVLCKLREKMEDMDYVPMADYFNLCDMPTEEADLQVGWSDISQASIEKIEKGYIIEMPDVDIYKKANPLFCKR